MFTEIDTPGSSVTVESQRLISNIPIITEVELFRMVIQLL
jgi:hypothetical protein